MAAPIVIKSKGDFDQQIKEAGNKLVVVDFYADWCGPCRMIAPKYVALAEEFKDVVFLKVNVDDNSDLAGEYGVNGIPHFAFLRGGKKIDEFSGANEGKLRSTVEKLNSSQQTKS